MDDSHNCIQVAIVVFLVFKISKHRFWLGDVNGLVRGYENSAVAAVKCSSPHLCSSAHITVDPTVAFITCTPTTCTLASSRAKLQRMNKYTM